MYRMAIVVSISTLLVGCSGMGAAKLKSGVKFVACADAPNCVSSQDTNLDRRIEAIRYTGTRAGAQQLMTKIVGGMQGAQIVSQQDGYLHATFTSATLGFIDDLELLFPPQKFIDVRSGSRAGYYDLGANRKRVEAIRKAFNDRQP